jgi:hypothetical protein
MTMVMSAGNEWTVPTVGARVVTADGEELGKVKEVVGGCFKVDASMQPDYWLGGGCIASATTSDVCLGITQDQLDGAKVDAPDNSGVQL